VRSRAWPVVALAALALGGGACGKAKSFIVLNLETTDATPISGVTEVDVTVSQPPMLPKMLTYTTSAPGLAFNATSTATLSVSFTGGRSGSVTLDVTAKDKTGCIVGSVQRFAVVIREGDTVAANVPLTPETCTPPDGGVDAVPESDAFSGCDPATPVCPPGDTCQVDCTKNAGECTPGGTGGPGAPCTTNMDCAPGSQCFDYSNTGCGVKICLRFCNGDDMCQAGHADAGAPDGGAADGGASDGGADAGASSSASSLPPSVCQGVVPCGSQPTPFHTCTFGCDPRQAAAAAGTTTCPAGLACIVVGSMDQVDCSCPEPTRKGVDGDDCMGGADCAPGYICNQMADTKKCRAICRCNNKNMACTAPNECGGGKTCAALTNETTYGVCL
jgi:hypothetical protein